ncbi:MAG: flagellin [Synergistaceae bacterium]|nr:flagellin [Synergistaceae bacterium]
MVINHNIPALQTYNIVNGTSNSIQKSIAKLSSGLRINSAADDAAGLAISEKMRAQIGGLDKAVANTQDGISLIQTAEGALQETHSILQRMRELSVQAANDTLTQQDRSYIQVEIDQLNDEITRIGDTTQFNKKKILNGDAAALWSSDNNETKAIINGGLRKTDQFGQKVSVEGNYKIRVKADPGQGEVQKSDIMKIKHDDVVINKTINTDLGVTDVSVSNVAAGSYKIELAESNPGAGAGDDAVGLLTGSYGLGGTMNNTDSEITFQDGIGAPVTKITVSTTDGVEIWSTTGSDLFKYAEAADPSAGTTAADQSSFFEGRTAESTASGEGPSFVGVKDEIIAAAAAKGITLSGFAEEPDENSGSFTLNTVTKNGTAPGIKITYETAAPGVDPTTAITVNDAAPVAADSIFAVTVEDNLMENASILFEVTNIDTVNQQVTLKATATKLSQDGVNSTATQDNIVLSIVDGAPQENAVNLDKLFGGSEENGNSVTINFNEFDGIDTLGISPVSEGAKFVYFVTAQTEESNEQPIQVNISGTLDSSWEDKWDDSPFNGNTLGYTLNGDNLADTEIHFKNFYLNEKTGNVEEGDIVMSTGSRFNMGDTGALADASTDPESMLARFDAAYIGKTATGDTKLRDLDKFWNSEGVFMLDDAKTITLNQGNGNTASVTLYANDTLDEVADKLNTAIADGLGQKKYVDDATKFVTFVGNGSTKESESVDGTFLIRSIVPGKSGEITLSGDEDLLNAFSLNTIQKSKETSFTVDVEDAHTGEVIKQGVKITGNVAKGLIDENVDVEFSELAGISASWNDNLKKFVYSSATEETTLHLSDNTTVLQIGANEGEDLALNIGDMRSHALGLDGVNVMSHDRAARSITIIDNAIDKVSTQRANLGAYQNRLEYTASNLTTASENLTSAESRIRDTDMAKEMMNFTKLNIMLQAGNSMLAQANQQPQNVLSLIR